MLVKESIVHYLSPIDAIRSENYRTAKDLEAGKVRAEETQVQDKLDYGLEVVKHCYFRRLLIFGGECSRYL